MSDKKQPAQQRVNVRIVKADDPEQRGGMKPIAKADGSLQISPEEAYTAGIWTKPPFDLRGLSKMVDESTILPQCIRAYKSNIAGFGIDVRYKDDFADADETPEMKAEWDRATEVVEMINMEQESNELFEDIVEARETYGCAYAEVIRDMDGNVIQLEFIEDTPSVEKSRRLDPRVEVAYFHRDHTENRMRKFRKYKQTVNGKTVYYKEFGDPRIMDPTSGEYVTELEFKSRANFLISLLPLLLLMLLTGVRVSPALLLLPLMIALLFLFALGVTLVMATLNVFFRDTRFLWSVISLLWTYATPIFYPDTIWPEGLRGIFHLNPMYQLIDFLRQIVIAGIPPTPERLLACGAGAFGMLMIGLVIFRRYEEKFVFHL